MTSTRRHHFLYGINVLTLSITVLICFNALLWAQENVTQNLEQITSHPADDLAPSLSPDGNWLAFVSKRTGNYDIWLKNMNTGHMRRLTKDRADEFHPVWESKQRYLIYVSQQSDAHGDLYRLDLRDVNGELIPKGEPERLTYYMGFDGYPSMSKNDQNVAWVSDRTGRPEIWLLTKRRKAVRQLTHGGATHPAWSPKQDYIAYTSFREDGNNGDIWLIHLSAPTESFEKKTPLDSLERAMWPVTKGPAVDGFPTWSKDANTLLFSRHDYDTNGDGRLSPADQSMLWSVDVRHLPSDSSYTRNPSFEMFRHTFDERIVLSARPVTPLYFDARQASWNLDSTTFFVSSVKGKTDVWRFKNPNFFLLTDDSCKIDFINKNFALPRHLNSTQLDSLSAIREHLTDDEKNKLWDRWTALHQIIDGDSTDSFQQAKALYEAGMCLTLLKYGDQAQNYFEYVLKAFPQAKEQRAWSELVVQTQKALPKKATHMQVVNELINSIEPLQLKYSDEPAFLAQTDILLGNLWSTKGDVNQAKLFYERVERQYPQFPDFCAQSLYLLGALYEPVDANVALQNYVVVLQKYPAENEWVLLARNRLVALSTQNAKTDRERVDLYKKFHTQLRELNASSAKPLFRAAALLAEMGAHDEAVALYDSIAAQYANQPEDVFLARLRRTELLVQAGEFIDAAAAFQQLADDYQESAPHLAQQATDGLVNVLLTSASDLERSKNWTIARMRYEQVLQMDPFNIKAHQGYIEMLFHLGLSEQAVEEYKLLKNKNSDNKIVLYALGLAYSYLGTPQRNNLFMPSDVVPENLEKSNSLLRQAMSRDYHLIEAYLALSYNYEMLENNLRWEKNKPQNFWQRAGGVIAAPVVSLYRTITFYDETKAPRYYENSIQVLTSALSLNDENVRPDLEAQIALNMANNYYNVGEFGFSKAYEFYHLRMQYDSTFADPYQEALILERMGHCAMVVIDAERGPDYLLRVIELYRARNDRDRVLVNTKRLALLYEFAEDSRNALIYYQQAADMEHRRRLYDGLLRSYRSLAFHNHLLNKPDEAVFYANKGLALLDDGLVERSEGKSLFPQIGILGIHIPIPFDLRRVGAKSVLQLTTDEEEAILYSILAATLQDDGQYQKAISFYEKKLDIYTQRFDYEAQAVFKNNIAYLYFLQGDYNKAWLVMTDSYWLARRKTKSIGVQLLNTINAGHILLTMATEPDESKRINVTGRHSWIITELNEMLRRTSKNAGLYAESRMHLYMLLADVLLIDVFTSPAGDIATNVPAAYRGMQNASKADVYLQKALAIAQDKGLVQDEYSIHLKRGKSLQKLGLLNDAVNEFTTSLNLAQQYQNFDILWRANIALGQTLGEIKTANPESFKFQHEPLYYFQQAVKISETHQHIMPGFTAAHRRQLVQEPYREIIQIYVEQGLGEKALALAERMRERHFYDMWHEEHIDLGGRRQDLFVTLDSLRYEIDDLEFKLEKASDVTLQQRLMDVRTEFDNVSLDMQREAPELEQFVKLTPVDINDLRTLLPDNLSLVYHIASEDQSLFWIISQDTVVLESVVMNKNAALQQLSNNQLPEEIKKVFEQKIAAPNIVFIPDYDFLVYSWSLLTATLDSGSPIVSISSSMTSFAQALRNNRPRGHSIYLAGESNTRQPENYDILDPVQQQSGNAFNAQRPLLAQADVIHFDAWATWNWMTSTLSSMQVGIPQSQPMTVSVKDLYSLNTNASHLSFIILNSTPPDPDAFVAWERAAIFSGMSSLIFSSNSTLDSTGTFYQQFYADMLDGGADQAFKKNLKTLKNSNDTQDFVQFVGSIDLADDDQIGRLHSTENLQTRADAAYQKREWEMALQLYSQLAKTLYTNDVHSKRLASALNTAQWEMATTILRDQIETQERLNNWQAVADAYRQVAVLSEYQQKTSAAQNARASYQRLVREYGLEYDMAAAWEFLAGHLLDGGSYTYALDFYTSAALAFQQQKNIVGLINTHRRIGAIYTKKLGDSDAAFAAYDAALKVAVDAKDEIRRAEILIEKSQACRHFSLLLLAKEYADDAKVLAQNLDNDVLTNQCDVLLAEIHFALGDVKTAVNLLDSVMTDTLLPTAVDALLLHSRLYTEQDNVQDAFRFAKRAVEIANRLRDVDYQELSFQYLASLYWYHSDFENALVATDHFLALNNGNTFRAHLQAAAVLIDMHEYDRATQHLQILHSTLQKYPDEKARANFYYLSSRATEDLVRAHQWADRAVALADSLAWSELAWRAEWRRAQLLASGNEIDAAAESYQQVLSRLNKSFAATRFDSYLQNFSASEKQFFEELVNFNIRHGKINSGLNIVEIFSQRLVDQQQFWNRHAFYQGETNFTARDSLHQELSLARISLLSRERTNDQTADVLHQQINDLQNQLLQNRRLDNTGQGISFTDGDSIDVQRFASTVPEDVLILRMFYDENNLHSWIISQDSIYYIQAPFDVDTLTQNIKELYVSLNTHESVDAPAAALYANLIAPAGNHLASKNTLVVIPYGALYNVPFDLLSREGTTPLGLEKQIIYATSLPQVFTMSNHSIENIGAVTSTVNDNPTLSLSENVAKSLHRYYSNVAVYDKDNFVDVDSLHVMNQHDAVYLGVSLNMNSRFPFDAEVVAPFRSQNHSDVFQNWLSQLSTSLLVFHSTRSADLAVDGQNMGFYTAVLKSTDTIMTPQWIPDELAGSVLLKRFFYYLSEGHVPAEALRLAQKIVYDQIDAHPSAWAVYRLFGDF